MKHIGINAKVASHVFSLLASVEGTTVCLEIPLQSPFPPGDRHLATVSPPPPWRTVARYPGSLQGGYAHTGTESMKKNFLSETYNFCLLWKQGVRPI